MGLGVWRPSLHHGVEVAAEAADKLPRLRQTVQRLECPGIVYMATVRAAEEVHAALCADGVAAGLYHGKSRAAERHAAQEAFVDGSTRVKVATNAFGMGIDKVDGRFVWHYQLPASLDAYSEESGRAGRDCQPADCLLLYARRDQAVQNFSLGGSLPRRPTWIACWRPYPQTARRAPRSCSVPRTCRPARYPPCWPCCSARATHPRARRWRHGLAARRAVGRAGGAACCRRCRPSTCATPRTSTRCRPGSSTPRAAPAAGRH